MNATRRQGCFIPTGALSQYTGMPMESIPSAGTNGTGQNRVWCCEQQDEEQSHVGLFGGGCQGSDAAPQLALRRILCGDVPSTAHVAGRKNLNRAQGRVLC